MGGCFYLCVIFSKASLIPLLTGINLDFGAARLKSFLVLVNKRESNDSEEEGIESDFSDTNLAKKMKIDLNFYNKLREKVKISFKNLTTTKFLKYKDGMLT